jgi:hypothetical protein
MLFEHVEGQIGQADTKAQLTLAADTLLAAALTLAGRGAGFRLLDPSAALPERIGAALGLLAFVALVISVYLAIVAARPRLAVAGQSRSVFYFGHVAQVRESEFRREFLDQSEADLRESLLAQIHAKAVIAQRKFANVRLSITFLIVALALWAAMQIALAFTAA